MKYSNTHVTDRAAGPEPRIRVAATSQGFRSALLLAVVVSAYLSIPLVAGGRVLVPSVLTVALAPILMLSVWSRFTTTDAVFMLKISFVLLVSIALSPGYVYLNSKLMALAQLCAGLLVVLLTVRLMQHLGARSVERLLLLLWVSIVVGCVLEIAGITREYSDAFRDWAYGSTDEIYDGDARDTNMVGWPRPKLFSVEPSHVSKLFVIVVNAWLLLRVTWPKTWIAGVATVFMIVVMGSPILVVSIGMTFLIVLWNQRARAGAKVAMVLAMLLVAIYFGFQDGDSPFATVADRLEGINTDPTERDDLGSVEQRTIYPFLVLLDTWSRWPFFGVGIGGKDVVFEHSLVELNEATNAMGKNIVGELGISLGLVGASVFLLLLLKHAHYTGVKRVGLFGILFMMTSLLMGGLVTFRYWGLVAILWGAMALADADSPELAVDRPP